MWWRGGPGPVPDAWNLKGWILEGEWLWGDRKPGKTHALESDRSGSNLAQPQTSCMNLSKWLCSSGLQFPHLGRNPSRTVVRLTGDGVKHSTPRRPQGRCWNWPGAAGRPREGTGHTTAAATPEHSVVGSLGPSWARLWHQDEGVGGAKTSNQVETWSWVKKGCPGLGSAFNSASFQGWLSDGQVGTGQGLSTSPGGS